MTTASLRSFLRHLRRVVAPPARTMRRWRIAARFRGTARRSGFCRLGAALRSAGAERMPPKSENERVRLDPHGDPLPDGAIARLGTVRFRMSGLVYACAWSPDGKTLGGIVFCSPLSRFSPCGNTMPPRLHTAIETFCGRELYDPRMENITGSEV